MARLEQVIDWQSRGYHRFPFGETPPHVEPSQVEGWLRFEARLERLKAGQPVDPHVMWDEAVTTRDWQLHAAYAYLIGHTAPSPFLRGLRPLALDSWQGSAGVLAARALALSGLLSEIPALLGFIRERLDLGEFQGAFWDIGRLLDDGSGTLADADVLDGLAEGQGFQIYEERVLVAVDALRDELRDDEVRVLRGAVFSLPALLRLMHRSAQSGGFDYKLRETFEAETGVDCTAFFTDRVAQPLAVRAILEDFEDRDGALEHVPGRRYFFGHPVPA